MSKVETLFSDLHTSMKDVGCGQVNENFIGKVVKLAGWVESVRDHGGLKFIDLVDITGEVQIVVRPENINVDVLKDLDNIRNFYVLHVEGEVRRRPEGTENPNIRTGNVEVIARSIKVLSKSEVPPFLPNERKQISEEVRLKYRYIDMRRPRMRRNIIFRHLVARKIREFMWRKNFVEIETPFLTKSTPEGARDFLVPSRVYKGKFYALPQSPQLFKQILQVAGFERYFQIVRCFRDEDLRADRQPEFTQVDIEMSFVSEEDIISLIEELLCFIFKECLDIEIKIPFPRMRYQDAISLYGTDKPDTRIPFHLKDLSDIFSHTKLEFIRKFLEVGGKVLAFGVKNISASKSQLASLESFAKSMGGGGLMWFVFKDNQLVASPVSKFISDEEKEALSQLCEGNGISFAVADTEEKSRTIISKVAKLVAKNFSLVKDEFNFVWIVDFPLFSWDETEKRFVSEHHPFTSPKYEDLGFLDTDPLKVRARAYDIVLNGEEIGGGSIRIHDPELQYKIFKILNLSQEEINERFGWFLEALKYGAPPHGGIALGLDRLVALMLGEESIREVIAFPKTQSGVCPLTGAPSDVYVSQLKELGIKVEVKE
ncbi:MAG: aspartate--tRNA ligase [Candidatus Calescibacterium sp.]|jgi:aspartyl-tRNA synthetase|nr:aspartate--tRNA ligase [Candidatus Calescibacterium sp.]